MSTGFHSYRGLELYPLVFPHQAAKPGFAHNYDEGFDAAVRIQEMEDAGAAGRSPGVRGAGKRPGGNCGGGRRGGLGCSEQLIDACDPDKTVWDSE